VKNSKVHVQLVSYRCHTESINQSINQLVHQLTSTIDDQHYMQFNVYTYKIFSTQVPPHPPTESILLRSMTICRIRGKIIRTAITVD